MLENAGPGRQLLVVDDDRLICWALTQELSVQPLAVSVCHDGTDALVRIRAASYDLVMLDVHLPDADGIAILEEVKRLSPGTRVIVMSADADSGSIKRAIAAGAEQFLEKPFDLSTVRGRILGMFREYPVARRYPRYLCRITVRVSLLAPLPAGAAGDADCLNGIAEDVGAGGVRVATDYPLATGQIVRVNAEASPADPFAHFVPPNGTAEVRWTSLAPGGFMAGLSFTGTHPLH